MKYILPGIFAVTALVCLWLLFGPSPFSGNRSGSQPQARIVSPQQDLQNDKGLDSSSAEQMAFEDSTQSKIALADGEQAVGVITQDLDGDGQDEQVIALRKGSGSDGPISLAFVDFENAEGGYKRVWDGMTLATRTRTFSVQIKDLVGDRSHCIIATGMNNEGEQTLTAFRLSPEVGKDQKPQFERIAELHTDGSLVVMEKERSQAYQMGLSSGESFKISSYGRDTESSNILDQIETSFAWDPSTRRYERVATARVPGTQIEQRRVRELLDGTPTKFETFLEGLWYYTPAEGDTTDEKQYLYFNPKQREIVFYADNTQEVFTWQNSSPTRYGLYITSQNISVTTLRRLIDIELSSVDAVHVKVFEDVKLKIGVTGRWDGTYHKMTGSTAPGKQATVDKARLEAMYDGPDGSLAFHADGSYELKTGGVSSAGLYAFFTIEGTELLELRSTTGGKTTRESFEVLRPAPAQTADGQVATTAPQMILRQVRLGVRGIDQLHERDLRFEKK